MIPQSTFLSSCSLDTLLGCNFEALNEQNQTIGNLAQEIFFCLSFLDIDYLYEEILTPFWTNEDKDVFDSAMQELEGLGALRYEIRLVSNLILSYNVLSIMTCNHYNELLFFI